MSIPTHELAGRWRLTLGRFAEGELPSMPGEGDRMAAALDFLYSREYGGRGFRLGSKGEGTRDASAPMVVTWLNEVRELFPKDVCETITRHALDRYGMTELVTDPATLKTLTPNYELLKTLLTFKELMRGEVLLLAEEIVRKVVEELREKLAKDVRQSIQGRRHPNRRTRMRSARNLDCKETIRRNLKHWSEEYRAIIASDLVFKARTQRHMTWDVIIAVDCSGSMMDSVIHSAVMAAIFAGLPTIRVRLVAFDTSVVDLTEHAADATKVLLSARLGGGTDIAGAVRYCSTLVEQPTRTILVCVTDFCEGGPLGALLAQIRRLRGDGVRFLGLAALDERAEPAFDREASAQCAKAGAEVGAMTPNRLAEWIGGIINA